jgi:c-di-GMP-binding flagellar brake protein YcgR
MVSIEDTNELRLRERKEYDKHILCFKCENAGSKVKVPFLFHVHDISYGGMKISLNQMLQPETILYFRMESNESLKDFQVEVVWSKHNGREFVSGVKFPGVTKEDIVFLYEIIKGL